MAHNFIALQSVHVKGNSDDCVKSEQTLAPFSSIEEGETWLLMNNLLPLIARETENDPGFSSKEARWQFPDSYFRFAISFKPTQV